ncbi:MAG: lysine 2,3-aminomutase [Candidatus Cloacimonetes bacterium]|jgi:lysine 2,3-aminomutase|nr:lysine 2,3-aminomutase [Candidatus Cloacimonadota bacterium]MDD3143633.1 lysine 2,3-aminomutase [Candidatus Cloacimonadota bacterium]MDY0366324.1 lysine 2,3-aminomutase [Candidatus Syntrophosphaera sp.]HOY83717.1 lysine 2,3-aminomutase [Candidatus Syntrophosphaera sp.]HPH60101.1 lysine 2,3-aminomutase [Candidatus Syntrophosphaera sp.]
MASITKIRSIATAKEWNDWHWQIRNRITDFKTLKKYIELQPEEEAVARSKSFSFRMAITPYYLSLIDPKNPHDPVRLQAIPRIAESVEDPSDMADPLHEDADAPVPGMTHRYPDRVLLLLTDQCSMYCRHCTRRRKAGEYDAPMPRENVDKAIKYIEQHKEVRDVILSGGDPLTMSDARIDEVLARLAGIDHVDIVRIGTRTPVVMPQRITDELIAVLKKYKFVWLNTHFNHPNELTKEAAAALAKLAEAGVVLGNQSVLLKGINDHVDVMKALVHALVRNRVRPYYIYQCDLSEGISHFRTPVSRGIEIIESLRGHTSGLCVPTYVVDAPGGGGKIPVMPNYIISQMPGRVILRNYEGFITAYTEPEYTALDDKKYKARCAPERRSTEGVMALLRGKKVSMGPADTRRNQRRVR